MAEIRNKQMNLQLIHKKNIEGRNPDKINK
jgi:hypothetical protein